MWFAIIETTLGNEPTHDKPEQFQNYDEKLSPQVSFKMIAIKGGDFVIGTPSDERGRRTNEGPQKPIRISNFWMGEHEVTWQEFQEFYRQHPLGEKAPKTVNDKAADAVTKPSGSYVDETYGFGEKGYPAINISHHAAMKYCEWLSLKTGKAYRLPTEAEWEYACRAGTKTAFGFGDNALDDYFWYRGNSQTEDFPKGQAHRVKQKKPNAWGLFDMHGNVSEWCIDHYEADRYEAFPWKTSTLNPVKLPSKKRYSYVTRGGDFASPATACRSGAREGSNPSWNELDPQEPPSIWWMFSRGKSWVGFRVVVALKEQTDLIGIRSQVTLNGK